MRLRPMLVTVCWVGLLSVPVQGATPSIEDVVQSGRGFDDFACRQQETMPVTNCIAGVQAREKALFRRHERLLRHYTAFPNFERLRRVQVCFYRVYPRGGTIAWESCLSQAEDHQRDKEKL